MKSLKLIGLALLAIMVGFVATSCGDDKEKDEPSAKTKPSLGLIYGFGEDFFNCFDIEIHYTDASGATKTEKITKTNCTKETISGQELYFYDKLIEYTKYPMDNVSYGVVLTYKETPDVVKDKYDMTYGYYRTTIDAGQSYDKAASKSKTAVFPNTGMKAEYIQTFGNKLNSNISFKGKTYKITSNGKFEEQ